MTDRADHRREPEAEVPGEADPLTQTGAEPTSPTIPLPSPLTAGRRPSRRRRVLAASGAFLLVAACSVGYLLYYAQQDLSETGTPAADLEAGGAEAAPSGDSGMAASDGAPDSAATSTGSGGSAETGHSGEGTEAGPERLRTPEELAAQLAEYQAQMEKTAEDSALLQVQLGSLQKDLEHARNQAEELEQEIVRRDKELADHRETQRGLEAGLEALRRSSAEREQALNGQLQQAQQAGAKLQASLEQSRLGLTQLQEVLQRKEVQFQDQVTSLQRAVRQAGEKEQELAQFSETLKARLTESEEQLAAEREQRARWHLEVARQHIVSMDVEKAAEQDQHLESALQQLYFAGQADPDRRGKYLQMATELLNERMERLRDAKVKRSEKERRMEHYLKLRAELSNS